MVKVLHSVLSMAPGGLENGIANLLRHHSSQFNVEVLCLRERGALADQLDLQLPGKIHFDGSSNPSLWAAIQKTRKAISIIKPDILHTHGWTTMLTGFIAAQCSSHSLKIINGEHGILYFDSWRRRFMQRWLMNHVDLNLSVSEALAQEVKTSLDLPSEKFKTIINGVDTQHFIPNPETKLQLRQDLNIPQEAVVLLAVGRLVEVKNYTLLIDVFSRLHPQFPQCQLVLCGDGDQRPVLEKLVQERNLSSQVTFLGYRGDVAQVMCIADIFVQSSVREGLPNTVLEALATSVPVVASNVGGTQEVLHHEVDGFLFPSENAQALFEALALLIEDPERRQQMGEAGRYKILQNFSIHAMVKSYENVYESLIK